MRKRWFMSKPRNSYWNSDILRPGYVGTLRARDPRDLLSAHRGPCAAVAVVGGCLVTLLDLTGNAPPGHHLGTYAFLALLGLVAITAHVALQPGARLRPTAALRFHGLALLGAGAALLFDLTDAVLRSPKPPHHYSWVPFLATLVFTYSAALIAATWLTAPARYLNTVIGAIALAWEAYLMVRILLLTYF